MKLAVISDIHGNFPALQRVAEDLQRWGPDIVVVNGDIVNRGPCSDRCWQFVSERAEGEDWQLLRGNHEDYVLGVAAAVRKPQGAAFEIQRFAYWTAGQLAEQMPAIAELDEEFVYLPPDGRELRILHASMRSNRDGIYTDAAAEKIRAQIAPPPAVFVTAHTHRPFIRQIGETMVVNVGAVGAPFDRDRRLSYGRFTWQTRRGWEAEIVRLEYDRAQIERDYVESGFLAEGGPLAQLMLLEHRKSHGLIYRWAQRYENAVRTGDLSISESVRRIMADADVQPFTGPPGWTISDPAA
jgi:predicted phosphodiesterase